jgi:hypothetical protein
MVWCGFEAAICGVESFGLLGNASFVGRDKDTNRGSLVDNGLRFTEGSMKHLWSPSGLVAKFTYRSYRERAVAPACPLGCILLSAREARTGFPARGS